MHMVDQDVAVLLGQLKKSVAASDSVNNNFMLQNLRKVSCTATGEWITI